MPRDPGLPSDATRRAPAGPVVLVGLSGAGKTLVGRLLAERLQRPFIDLDSEVERLEGLSVPEIFAARGEDGFRELEKSATVGLDAAAEAVVSTGGGWMARPELRDAWPGAVRVWLGVDPATAAARLAQEPRTRPLLAGPDPEASLRELLAERLPAYRLAEVHVRTDEKAPSDVVDEICRALAGGCRAPGTG